MSQLAREWDGLRAGRLSRYSRIPAVVIIYTIALIFSYWLAHQLRFDFGRLMTDTERDFLWKPAYWMIPLKLAFLLAIGQVAGLLSYFSVPDLRRLFAALLTASTVAAVVSWQTAGAAAPPLVVILADFMLSFLFISAARLLCRLVRERVFRPAGRSKSRMLRVGVIGAGYAGATLARELDIKKHLGLKCVAFFDDNPQKWGSSVHGIRVLGAPEILLENKSLRLDKVIIAMPSAAGRRVREIVSLLQRAVIRFETVPTLDQLATGKVKVSQLRPVEIEDLLGREPVKLETEPIRSILRGQVVMVTGAGGSIGSELCRQIASFGPARVLLVEQSEVQMFQVEQELISLGYGHLIVPLVADVFDLPRMQGIFDRYQPQIVFHAAAHKHVPMMEAQPVEAIKNNVIATAQLARLALDYAVDRFVLISTDKAINPTNVMGATKRLAEIYLQSLHANQTGRTKIMAVRFGNVLGSSGSVIPIFHKQIAAGGPVTVTHPEVTRYFMTIAEAVGLVLQSASQGQGGEIFVLDMGKPVRILDLARQMIELHGLKPEEDVDIEFIGLRPGEKLYEELSHHSENCVRTTHPKIMRFVSHPASFEEVSEQLTLLGREIHNLEADQVKLLLKKAVPEYQPFLRPEDMVRPLRKPSKEYVATA
jgi:FlaA1/EpsC-like NDP-sugar epimerase